ncbi:lytic transglycosylase domain-containing protein [Psychrobacter sp. I-STPA10]|uniref:lytic transglycosylase domain-containing protein n=1 Tax=Psychrobacter sp. I-STPA10 TaxID=2585769 RepID=UPI001E332FCA|nr:lytic transglycosylase domain-containing protein [Psychrobacter sp. I-STPA10]
MKTYLEFSRPLSSHNINALLRQSKKYGVVVSAISILGLGQVACAQQSYQPTATNYSNDASITYFNQAAVAAKRGDIGALYNYEQMMGNGLFAVYPAYWRLNDDLESQSSAAIAQFARQYNGSVMAEKLAADYAETKARSGDYAAVRQVANLVINADDSEKCAIGLGYNQSGDTMRTMAIKDEVWLTTKKQPDLCVRLATELNSNPMISNQDRLERLKRMLRVGKTGDIIALSSRLGVPIDYASLAEIQLNPNTFLNRFKSQPPSQLNQYLYLYAIGRMADKSYREAAAQLNYDVREDSMRIQPLLTDATRQYAYRIIGVKRMNYNTDDGFSNEAVEWFRQSLGQPFNFEEAEDYAQAAIRFGQWADLVTAISSMSTETQKESIWQYWLARAYEQVGDASKKSLAKQMYQTLARSNDYYGLLAKDKIGLRYNAAEQGGQRMPVVTDYDRQRVMQDPNFARAFTLYDAGAERGYANREWNWAVKKARDNWDNALIIAAARLAYDKGWLDRAIYAIDSTDTINALALSHPMPYQDSVVRYSQMAGIDPAWAYGIMRQESRFVSSARSGVGASGLMQIMPATAKYIARNLGEPYSSSRANNGDTNIRYGTWYMSDILAKLNYQPVLATAGYNAGPNKAKRWQPNYGQLAADQYVETIAYPETRNYVKRVMENATIYSSLLGHPIPISQRMGVIPASF